MSQNGDFRKRRPLSCTSCYEESLKFSHSLVAPIVSQFDLEIFQAIHTTASIITSCCQSIASQKYMEQKLWPFTIKKIWVSYISSSWWAPFSLVFLFMYQFQQVPTSELKKQNLQYKHREPVRHFFGRQRNSCRPSSLESIRGPHQSSPFSNWLQPQ